MNKFVTIGLGAAAVVVLVFVGAQLFGSPSGGTGRRAEPEPTADARADRHPRTIPVAAASAPPLTQSFTSTLHGFSVSYPEGWTAQAATEPLDEMTRSPSSFGHSAKHDFLYDPTLTSNLFLTIASQPIGDSTPEDWVAEQMASDEGCHGDRARSPWTAPPD